MPPGLSEIRSSALWHFHDYDLDAGTFTMRQIEEPKYHEASFLDQRIESECGTAFRYALENLDRLFPSDLLERRATMFIFHIGHCGSTLLSRALDADQQATLPVREPLPLRHLARERRKLGQATQATRDSEQAWSSRLFTTLQALSRSFRPGQIPVVKATSTCNNLVWPILKENPLPRAILMYVRLEAWMAGMLGKPQPPLDLRGHAETRLQDWASLKSAADLEQRQMEEAELAVLGWLTGIQPLIEVCAKLPERTLLVDFEDFLQRPWSGLPVAADFFGLGDRTEAILAHWPEVSAGYSKKPDHPYTPAHRQRILQRGRDLRGEDIRRGIEWAEELIELTPALRRVEAYLR